MWTLFWDMHSGGGIKEKPYNKIYIEAPKDEAKIIFYNRFGHSPNRITCTCCGEDYSISESKTLEQASSFYRTSLYNNKSLSLKEYITLPNVLVIYKKDIKPEERIGEVPKQGYVWID